MNVIYRNIKLFTLMAAMVALVGCNNDEKTFAGNDDSSFEIQSSDLACVSGQEQVVAVPAEGYMYSFMVDAGETTSWIVTVEGGAWLTVNPVAKQKGNGEIIIKASANSYNESNRTSLVTITNTANNDVYTYRFNQEYDSKYIRPEYVNYTFLEGSLNHTCVIDNLILEGEVSIKTFTDVDELDLPDYNFIYESSCEMISKECFENLKFADNKLTVRFTNRCASLNKSKEYVLPVTLCVNGKEVKRLWIVVKIKKDSSIPDADELPEISLVPSMLKVSSQRWSKDHERIVDHKIETVWQSIWNPGVNPKFDATYGVYIDVTLKDDVQLKYLTFNYATGTANNNVPSHIKVYVGETKEDLVLLGEYKRTEDNLPTAVSTWFRDKSALPVFSLGGMKAKIFRISFIRSYDAKHHNVENDLMTDVSHNTTNMGLTHPAVTISELKLYGK